MIYTYYYHYLIKITRPEGGFEFCTIKSPLPKEMFRLKLSDFLNGLDSKHNYKAVQTYIGQFDGPAHDCVTYDSFDALEKDHIARFEEVLKESFKDDEDFEHWSHAGAYPNPFITPLGHSHTNSNKMLGRVRGNPNLGDKDV